MGRKSGAEAEVVVRRLRLEAGDVVLVRSDDASAAEKVALGLAKAGGTAARGFAVPLVVVPGSVTVEAIAPSVLLAAGWVRDPQAAS